MKKIFNVLIPLVLIIAIFTACNNSDSINNSSDKPSEEKPSTSSKPSENTDKDNSVTDKELLEKLLFVVQRYEFTAHGTPFDYISDAKQEAIFNYAIINIISDNHSQLYNKENMNYVIPIEQVKEFVEITFGLYDFLYYSPNVEVDGENYITPEIAFGYVVEHKIREATHISDNEILVIVDGYYPEETTPSAGTKEYIFKKAEIQKDYKYYGEDYPKGRYIYRIKSVNKYLTDKISDHAISFDNPKEITIYKLANTHDGNKLKPIPVTKQDGFTTYDLIEQFSPSYLNLNDYITLNFEGSQPVIYVIQKFEDMDFIYENSIALAETISQNSTEFNSVIINGYNGEDISLNSKFSPYFENGFYKKGSMSIVSATMAELEAIAKNIPFKMEDEHKYITEDLYFNNAGNKTAREITDYLSKIYGVYYKTVFFDNPSEIPPSLTLATGLNNAQMLYWGAYAYLGEEDTTFMELAPFSETCNDWSGILEIHAKQAAENLLGKEVFFNPKAPVGSKWTYDEYGKIYTPPHMSVGYKVPVVLEYTDNQDSYTATVAFISLGYGIYIDGELTENQDVWGKLQNSSHKQLITINKTENGLKLYSAIPIV